MKRAFDIALSLLALSFLILPLLLIMLILRLTGEGEVFYPQDRIGRDGKHFKVFKFATMRKDSESTGTKDITLRNDPRVLPVGHFLRMTKVNELPQLFNILLGDMSFVGWRPLTTRAFSCYPEQIQKQIVALKPGLTGVGSIFFRDEERFTSQGHKTPEQIYREDIAPYKGALELWYQQHQCMVLDLKIIFLTGWVVLKPDSNLHEKWFHGLPPRPASLQG